MDQKCLAQMRNKAVVKTLMYLLCCHKRTVLARVVTEISAVHGLHLSKSDLTTFRLTDSQLRRSLQHFCSICETCKNDILTQKEWGHSSVGFYSLNLKQWLLLTSICTVSYYYHFNTRLVVTQVILGFYCSSWLSLWVNQTMTGT